MLKWMANSSEETVYTQNLQENRLIWRRHSASNQTQLSKTVPRKPNILVQTLNLVLKQLKSEPAKPVKSAKKMELVVAKRTRPGRLVKTPVRYSS